MELSKGYKNTEIGVIPSDWEVIKLFDIIEPNRSIRYGIVQPGKFEPNGCLMLRSQDYSKGWSNSDEMHRVDVVLENQYKNARLNKDDLIMTVVGAGIGQVVITPSWLDKAIVSRSTARIAIDKTKAAKEYILCCLISPLGIKQILDAQKEGAQPVISCLDLAKFNIPYPPIQEQKAIAKILSDTDALINSLEKLITKKRNIKQGAMQKLLKPKEGWEVKKLGEILKVKHGKDQKEFQSENGNYPILGTGGLMALSSKFLYDKPSVLIGRKGTIDKPQFMQTPFWTVDTLFYTEIFKGYDAKFIYYIFNLIDWYSYNEASGVPSLNAKTIEKIEKGFPSFEEQTRIATILSDMDNEITGLEAKLEKYRKVKLGMMQNLLTGKIRLV
ncbi:restriction endonuclease subunit S domain-containing protein [Emticicia fontis]